MTNDIHFSSHIVTSSRLAIKLRNFSKFDPEFRTGTVNVQTNTRCTMTIQLMYIYIYILHKYRKKLEGYFSTILEFYMRNNSYHFAHVQSEVESS